MSSFPRCVICTRALYGDKPHECKPEKMKTDRYWEGWATTLRTLEWFIHTQITQNVDQTKLIRITVKD